MNKTISNLHMDREQRAKLHFDRLKTIQRCALTPYQEFDKDGNWCYKKYFNGDWGERNNNYICFGSKIFNDIRFINIITCK